MDSGTIVEIVGAIAGLLYVYLEIVQKSSMWIVGGISALIYITVFLDSGLYAAGFLQVCFLLMSIYGWILWRKSGDDSDSDKVKRLGRKKMLFSILATTLLYVIVTFSLINYSSDPMPFVDSLIAVLSLLATYWVTGKHAENWIVWIINNSIAIYLYASQGLYPTVLLYTVYLIAALIGYRHWRKLA
ncbi:MAG: nicotinamide riboside transporter PnuC [Bacteroidales bacterium]|nr:nicotinamide riboside transporter PnuC [Bacteroidales bacterium]